MCILRQWSEHLALKSRKEVKTQQYDSQLHSFVLQSQCAISVAFFTD